MVMAVLVVLPLALAVPSSSRDRAGLLASFLCYDDSGMSDEDGNDSMKMIMSPTAVAAAAANTNVSLFSPTVRDFNGTNYDDCLHADISNTDNPLIAVEGEGEGEGGDVGVVNVIDTLLVDERTSAARAGEHSDSHAMLSIAGRVAGSTGAGGGALLSRSMLRRSIGSGGGSVATAAGASTAIATAPASSLMQARRVVSSSSSGSGVISGNNGISGDGDDRIVLDASTAAIGNDLNAFFNNNESNNNIFSNNKNSSGASNVANLKLELLQAKRTIQSMQKNEEYLTKRNQVR